MTIWHSCSQGKEGKAPCSHQPRFPTFLAVTPFSAQTFFCEWITHSTRRMRVIGSSNSSPWLRLCLFVYTHTHTHTTFLGTLKTRQLHSQFSTEYKCIIKSPKRSANVSALLLRSPARTRTSGHPRADCESACEWLTTDHHTWWLKTTGRGARG